MARLRYRRWVIASAAACLALVGCGDEPAAKARVIAAVSPSAAWTASARVEEVGAAPMASIDKAALAELLAAASAAPAAAAPSSSIGSDTGIAEGKATAQAPTLPEPSAPAAPNERAREARRGPSDEATERAARADLEWSLTQRCRSTDGAILPPESIDVMFRLDDDARIAPATIVSIARDKRFDKEATCMRRELSKSAFRGPPSARGAFVELALPAL